MKESDVSLRRPSAPTASPAGGGASPTTGLFRQQALQKLDVATEIDNQLPLTPRRTWLALAGLVLLAATGVLWAALTPSQTSVPVLGRVVTSGGISQISTMVAGTINSSTPITGTEVRPGDSVFTIMTSTGDVEVSTMVSGTIWQVLTQVGAGVESGAILATVLPDGSSASALLVVPEDRAAGVATGERVVIGDVPNGTVTAVSAPLPAADVTPKVGLPLASDGLYVIITASLDSALTPGSEVQGRIILTEESVLARLVGAR